MKRKRMPALPIDIVERAVLRASEQAVPQSDVWVRDVTEEGIEPHPGPRYLSKNVNSVLKKGKLFNYLKRIRNESTRTPITAVFIQDHRLPRSQRAQIEQMAKGQGLLAITNHSPPHPRNRVCYGGTMIVIPHEAIERKDGESLHEACDRIKRTQQNAAKGRYVSIIMTVDKAKRKLTAAYAPANPPERPDYFTAIAPRLTTRTVLGIDANCVPNTTLDLKRDATSQYDNRGADILRDAVDRKGLLDVVREVKGKEQYFSSHHVVAGGTCWSRIDQIYAPHTNDSQYTVGEARDIFPRESAVEMDHTMVDVSTKTVKPEKGKDLPRINESIFDEPTFIHELHTAIKGLHIHINAAKPDGWRTGWEGIKTELRKLCLERTKNVKYKASKQVERKRKILKNIDTLIQKGTAQPCQLKYRAQLKKELRTTAKSDYTLHQTLEKEAYNMGKTHDRCTREFFVPWRDTHAAQHIESLAEADWQDPSNPTFTGRNVRGVADVLRELTKYYTALFADKPTTNHAAYNACLDTLSDQNSNRVLPPTAADCGKPITEDEVLTVMSELPLGKSPGPDRLPNKLYKTLAKDLAPILTAALNEGRQHGELHPTCIEGIISVLYKKKDRKDPRNYRPITLLNGDYKILTRVLTQRMNTAVLQFVSSQQNGFVPGGFLPENIMLLKLLQAWLENEDEDGFLVYLDMEKAFDRCSWQYLTDALAKIGFGPAPAAHAAGPAAAPAGPTGSFIEYVSLFYSHNHPPTRQLCMNGTLGPKFQLHSGVAQGCPLSPLLFLVITEALTRLIVKDANIEGITINGVNHKITQYADDSTLIPKHAADWRRMAAHLATWCDATSMKENAAKREGQLLGKLNRERHRAPTGIIKDDAWVKDGESIRALGVPMGNKLDLVAWWTQKYRQIKQRIAAWRSTAHMSITGRSLLLQAILYGSIRFWFFTILMSNRILELFESDAYHLVWASKPNLLTNEDGTSTRARAYIHAPATYLDQKQGGAGLPHLKSHMKAFHAQWIRRYLHPSNPPWKSIADIWLAEPYSMKRGAILTNVTGSLYTDIPATAPYLRACVKAFEEIRLQQDTTIIDHRVAGESIFFNPRFDATASDDHAATWAKYIGLHRINNLFDTDTGKLFTQQDMDNYTTTLAPDNIVGTPKAREWADDLMQTWPALINSVPKAVTDAAKMPTQIEIGTYVVFTPEDDTPDFYAKTEPNSARDPNQPPKYHIQKIDTFGTPHNTGTYVSTMHAMRTPVAPATLWIEYSEEDAHYTFQNRGNAAEKDEEEPPKIYIAGPPSLTFPIADGWAPADPHPDPQYAISTLPQLSIKRLTKLFTHHAVETKRPNCEANWQSRIRGPPIPWDEIWPSLGTPLSDATEERNWRKLLHRAIFVRNRDPKARTHACRLRCGDPDESMLHLITCMYTRPFWNAVRAFVTNVLGEPHARRIDHLIIFNTISGAMISTDACAFIRHAVNCFYRDFAMVDTHDRAFTWELTFADAMHSFRSAVFAWAQSIRVFTTIRRHTNQKKQVPSATLQQFYKLVTFTDHGYTFALTPTFRHAIAAAERAAAAKGPRFGGT